MYDSENTFWYSQLLLNHVDKDYQTDGQLRISMSTNTKDFLSFNPVTLSISITDTIQNRFKTTVLNIQNVYDLFASLREFTNVGIPSQVLKKYNKGQDLVFDFLKDNRTQESIVRISIRNSDSDFTKVIVNYFLFGIIVTSLKEFMQRYTHACMHLPTNLLFAEILKFTKTNFLSLKEKMFIPPIQQEQKQLEPEVKEIASSLEDLDKFIGGSEMTNIKVTELQEIPVEQPVDNRSIMKVDSNFVSKFLFNDLSTLETELEACKLQKNGIDYFSKRIQPLFDFAVLDLEEHEYKSLVYTTQVLSQTIIRSYIEKGTPFPPSIPTLKCHFKDIKQSQIDLAFDLLVFNAYIRSYRKKLESCISDATLNGSMFYLLFRCFTDPFCFSVIDKQDQNVISSIIMKSFKYYRSIGVFKKYESRLEEYGCQEVTENEIVGFIEELGSKVLGKSPFVSHLHNTLFTNGSLKLDINIDFSLEQIINEVVPLEVSLKLGYDVTSLDFYKLCSKDVIDVFVGKKKQKEVKKDEPTSNLFRLAKQYHHEVPEKYKKEFFELVAKLETSFDFNDLRFPLEEFGENIVKVLYCWNPESDQKIKTNYKHYFELFENEIMTKDLILAKMKNTKVIEEKPKEEKKDSDWNIFENIKFE